MDAKPIEELKPLFSAIIQRHTSNETWSWLQQALHMAQHATDSNQFAVAFVCMPRKTGKGKIQLTNAEEKAIQIIRPGIIIREWSLDHLSRVLLLMHLSPINQAEYFNTIEKLFSNAEMNELVALYSALPFFAYPEMWRKRCADGIRSNIGIVLYSIICNNPYPAEQLDEQAWNQLVLKGIFTEKPIHQIIGLQERANSDLAYSLAGYAEERWAAHRTVHPLIWKCVGKFIDQRIFPDIKRIFLSLDSIERMSAALACYESSYLPAQELLNQSPGLKKEIESGEVRWETIVQRTELV
jgi:hypothetical protein